MSGKNIYIPRICAVLYVLSYLIAALFLIIFIIESNNGTYHPEAALIAGLIIAVSIKLIAMAIYFITTGKLALTLANIKL
ncbi:hypothetical protein [Brucella gallinifaecis]|uniref:hypothetical protein n=1 Tax=Brucella gallinifaecis TaxID=215590 RepID=UPI00235FB80E|nr:hypothetical protein [Brucella gallinifaecis]